MTINRSATLYAAATILYALPVLSMPTSRSLVQACKTGDVGRVKLALTLGWLWLDVNYKLPPHQKTPLTEAAKQGNDEIVQLLLDAGARVDLPGWAHCTALDNAISGGHETVVKRLLDAAADPEHIRADGREFNNVYTPLQRAALGGHTIIAQMLIDAGVKPDRINRYGDGWNALCCAAKCGHVDTVKTLLAAGAKADQSLCSSKNHYYHQAYQHSYKVSPLLFAAENGHAAVVWMLLENRGKSTLDWRDNWDMTPLHHAAANGHAAVVQVLIEAKDKLDRTDRSGMTPLHHAVKYCHPEVVRLLLENGAPLDLTNVQGMTPIDLVEKCLRWGPSDLLAKEYKNIKQILLDFRATSPHA